MRRTPLVALILCVLLICSGVSFAYSVLTHEEIAEMIGTSRETVSRLFADFRMKHLIESKGSSLVILNKLALEGMVA